MKIYFYLTVDTDKSKIVALLVFVCTTASFKSFKFRLSKMHRSKTPFSLRLQNSEYPRIFRVTGANQNARNVLFTNLVNTNVDWYIPKQWIVFFARSD